jgi:hypothetical protein
MSTPFVLKVFLRARKILSQLDGGAQPQTYGSKSTGMKYHESWVYKHPNIQINYFGVKFWCQGICGAHNFDVHA